MKKYFIALFLILFSTAMYADQAEIERENLAKLVTEIDFLVERVAHIRHQRFEQSRIKFKYQVLHDDLLLMKSGINDFLEGSLNQGRFIEPLNGNYR